MELYDNLGDKVIFVHSRDPTHACMFACLSQVGLSTEFYRNDEICSTRPFPWGISPRPIEKLGESKIGGGALLGFTPFRGPHPHLTLASYSPGDPEKNGF